MAPIFTHDTTTDDLDTAGVMMFSSMFTAVLS